MEQILLLLFVLISTISIAFGLLFLKMPILKTKKNLTFLPEGVSLLVCAKSEATNLERFLPMLLQQDYPKDLWELIVVNDRSTDESAAILKEMQLRFPQLKVITISKEEKRNLPGKKDALDKGIQAAKFDTILLTDADCYPSSDQWLKKLLGFKQQNNKQIVLGYGKYKEEKGTLNRFIRWETIHTAIQYFSYSKLDFYYMGVGRNLMYEKQLYFNLKNDKYFWELYQQTPSGDDDLLISRMATKHNTGIFYSADAQTISIPQSNWKSWFKQKSRHLSTGKYYPPKIKILLGVYALSHSLFWILGLLLFIWFICIGYAQGCIILTVFILLRILVFGLAFNNWSKALQEKNIISFILLGDVAWCIYNVILSPYIFWKNKQQWK